jgi:hypothetical protein
MLSPHWSCVDEVDWDCLGCVNEALRSGVISQGQVDEYHEDMQAIERQWYGVCPSCGNARAYISEYEPGMMHCGECGIYSGRPEFSESDDWTPFMQGTAIDNKAADRYANKEAVE